MSGFVLDTSAVRALFWQERGWERVSAVLESGDHVVSTVNLAELATKFVDAALPIDKIPDLVAALRLDVKPFDAVLALRTAALRASTRHLGLSLGDHACLALAQQLGAIAPTADNTWLQLDPALGIAVESVRPAPR